MFNVSRPVIVKLIKNNSINVKSNGNGKKIILTKKQKYKIKELYINEYKNSFEIAEELGLTKPFIEKFLNNTGYRRNKSEGVSVGLVKRYSNIPYNEYLIKLPEFKKYKREVLMVTNKQFINTLDNYNKRGVSGKDGAYHLDHRFSIMEGFKQGVNPEIIGQINNLEFIPWEENLTKRCECSITLDKIK